MEYSGVSSLGSRVQVPSEWLPVLAKIQELSLAGKIAFLKIISAYNHSEAMYVASTLGSDMATPLVPTNSAEHRIALIVRWLASPEFSPEEKEAMVWAWKLKDFTTVSEAESNPNVPLGVRMLLRQVR
jgi:hypothetical protein